jgi:hypothetical protein
VNTIEASFLKRMERTGDSAARPISSTRITATGDPDYFNEDSGPLSLDVVVGCPCRCRRVPAARSARRADRASRRSQ